MITAHGGQTSAVETFGDRSWLGLDTVYTYADDQRPLHLAALQREPARPFVLIESTYEGEHDAKPERVRRQAWTAMLSGATGQFFGNNPMWHFDGPTLFPFTGDWRTALDGVGSRDMTRLGSSAGCPGTTCSPIATIARQCRRRTAGRPRRRRNNSRRPFAGRLHSRVRRWPA